MKNVSAALVKAQQAFGPALKSSTNPHFKSRYADLAACVEAVVDALNANGIALVQRNIECAEGVCVETVFIHESGEMLSSGPLHVPAAKQDPQGYGSALTYARRYSLMAACGIAPEDDDGNSAAKAKPAQRQAAPIIGARAAAAESSPIPADERPFLDDLARELEDIFKAKGKEAAFERVDLEHLDNDQKLYLSTKIPSAITNGMREVSAARHARIKAHA
jgi:hypothetical protein